MVPLVWDALQPGVDRQAWLGVGRGLTGIVFAVWQLWPPPDGQLPTGLFTRFEPFRIRETLSQAFAPRARRGQWTLVVGVLVTGLTIARLWSAPRAALVFGLSCAGLGYVFVFKYASGVHHYGLFFIAIVMALWMAEGAPSGPLAPSPLLSRRAFTVAMLVALLPSLYIATRVWTREVKYAFSEAADMARFIQASRLDQARIAAHPPMGAVLAFLPRLTFWYPAIGEEGSHMKWDARYRAGSDMTVSAAAALMKAQCPDWQDARDPVLLLVNTPLPDAAGEGYRLLYSTPGRPWLVSDEVFHLYAPATFAPDFASRARDRKPLRPRKPTCQPPSAPASPSPSTRGQRAEQAYHLLTIRMVLDHVWSAPWHGWEDTLEDHYGDRERIRLFGQRPTSGSIASEKTWYRGMLCYKTNRCSSAEPSGRVISMSIRSSEDTAVSESILATLKEDGVVCLPNVFGPEQLTAMQQAFNARLGRLRWNNLDGYEKTEPYRHMVEDVLTLEQGFVDAALHPIVKQVLATYLGQFALVEARGWRSLPTRRDFHGWHADEWYDQRSTEDIPKEVKLGFYLTDVRSGAFTYIKGSQRRQHPRRIRTADLPDVPTSQIAQIAGPAGTAFLFDTSGIHRQGVPLLEPRHVVFCNYHDPLVRLQKDDIDSYRYHPLILNAAFLGNLSDEDRRILGFGDKTNYVPAFDDRAGFTGLHKALGRMHDANLRLVDLRTRIATRLNRTLRKGPR